MPKSRHRPGRPWRRGGLGRLANRKIGNGADRPGEQRIVGDISDAPAGSPDFARVAAQPFDNSAPLARRHPQSFSAASNAGLWLYKMYPAH
jgi:hypothetical protein